MILLLKTPRVLSNLSRTFAQHKISLTDHKRHLATRRFSGRNTLVVDSYCSQRRSNLHVIQARQYLHSQVLRPYVDPKLSYAYGRSEESLIYSTIARELSKQVISSPNEVAIVSHAEKIAKTVADLDVDISRLAKSLTQKFGISKGDTVGVFSYNCYNWILIQYACSKIGAILTPINPSYKAHELAFVLKQGKIKCLFMPGPRSVQSELNRHLDILQSQEILDLSSSGDGFLLEHVIFMDHEIDYNLNQLNLKLRGVDFQNWSSTQDNDARVFHSEQEADEANVPLEEACILSPELVSPDDLFAIYYTSGTTGTPKGACVSQYTVINNVRLCQARLRNARPRNWRVIVATVLPMFHIFAGVLNALSPAVSNTKVIFSSYRYDIRTFVESIIEHEANLTTLTPTILIDMLTYIEQNKLGDAVPLKIIQPGGAALPPELVSRAFKLLAQLEDVRTGYGSTENGAVATFQTIYEPESFRAHTVGPPIDFTEVRVVKAMSGSSDQCVPLGQVGEVQTRGHNTMIEYLNSPDKTREVLTRTNWYRTGDLGVMHPHGSVSITGRLKHMIIKGGENIFPQEVEDMMHRMEGIEKVHVVGVPDERFGEQVCAWIQLKPGYEELKEDYNKVKQQPRNPKHIHKQDVLEFCRQNITYFKVPKYLMFVDEFPMTPTKKVQSHIIVEESIRMLGLKKQ